MRPGLPPVVCMSDDQVYKNTFNINQSINQSIDPLATNQLYRLHNHNRCDRYNTTCIYTKKYSKIIIHGDGQQHHHIHMFINSRNHNGKYVNNSLGIVPRLASTSGWRLRLRSRCSLYAYHCCSVIRPPCSYSMIHFQASIIQPPIFSQWTEKINTTVNVRVRYL